MNQTNGSVISSTSTVGNIEDVLNTIQDVQNSLSAAYLETSLILKNALEPIQLLVPELKKAISLPQMPISADSSSRKEQPEKETPSSEKLSPQRPEPVSGAAPSESPKPSTSSKKWMLKHQGSGSGLTELMPNSGIYVSEIELKKCNLIKTDMRKFGRLLLPVVFSKEALLKGCFYGKNKLKLPTFNEHDKKTFLDYVTKHAKESGWEIVTRQSLIHSIHTKINSLSKHKFKYSPVKVDF